MSEPNIIINGDVLTNGEAMIIRVAIKSFAMDLENGLGKDELGKQIAKGYKYNIDEIRRKMFKK